MVANPIRTIVLNYNSSIVDRIFFSFVAAHLSWVFLTTTYIFSHRQTSSLYVVRPEHSPQLNLPANQTKNVLQSATTLLFKHCLLPNALLEWFPLPLLWVLAISKSQTIFAYGPTSGSLQQLANKPATTTFSVFEESYSSLYTVITLTKTAHSTFSCYSNADVTATIIVTLITLILLTVHYVSKTTSCAFWPFVLLHVLPHNISHIHFIYHSLQLSQRFGSQKPFLSALTDLFTSLL